MPGLNFMVNGREYSLTVSPLMRLLDLLREELRLTGTKESCGEGECGSCTVLLDGRPVLSCLLPVIQVAGREVTTIEGLQGDPLYLALEQALSEAGSVQCGFCTPGIVVSSWAWLRAGGSSETEAIKQALAGNLCRCTGYQKIIDGVQQAVRIMAERTVSGEQL